MRYGVASDQADKFLDSFVESVVYAGLGKFDGNKVTLFPRDAIFKSENLSDDADDDPIIGQAAAPQQESTQHFSPHHVHAPEPAPVIPVALRQTWPIEAGEIEFVIRTPKAMPPAIYALMATMAEVAAEMEKLLKPADGGATPISLDGN